MKIGVFGGTFNPPHVGHLIAAECTREIIGLDKVLFVPSATPPHKRNMDIVEAHYRVEMLRRALLGNRRFEVSEVEIERGGVSFTVDTLEELAKRNPGDQLFLIVGGDLMAEFHTWKDPENILRLAEIVVMTRPGAQDVHANAPMFKGRVRQCPVPLVDLSSTAIRRRVAGGKSIKYLVPTSVELYIIQQDLYGPERRET